MYKIISTIKIEASPGCRSMQGTTKMKGIHSLFFPYKRVKIDQYNSFLREVVAMEEALREFQESKKIFVSKMIKSTEKDGNSIIRPP